MKDTFKDYLNDVIQIYSDLEDEESKCIFRGRYNYTFSRDENDLYKELHSLTKEYHADEFVKAINKMSPVSRNVALCGDIQDFDYSTFVLNSLGYRIAHYISDDYDCSCDSQHKAISINQFLSLKVKFPIIIVSRQQPHYYYEKLLYLKYDHDLIYYPRKRMIEACCGNQYFDLECLKLTNEEVFVDCGAYTGDTILDFAKKTNKMYKRIYAFEIDTDNYKECLYTVNDARLSNVIVVNTGLSNIEGNVPFEGGKGTGSKINRKEGKQTCSVTTLDKFLNGKAVSFIKMDIEGEERKALIGAQQTIRKFHPKLAIAIYHRIGDFISIPIFLKQLVPDYHFYYRHYRSSYRETILYAVVD